MWLNSGQGGGKGTPLVQVATLIDKLEVFACETRSRRAVHMLVANGTIFTSRRVPLDTTPRLKHTNRLGFAESAEEHLTNLGSYCCLPHFDTALQPPLYLL